MAVNGSQSAAPFILESGKAVIAMGGFTGSDPAPTLSEFKHLVATGKVHEVYISGTMGGAGGGAPGGGGTSGGTGPFAGGPPGGGGLGRSVTARGGFPGGASGAGGRTSSTTSAIDTWVEKHGTVVSSTSYGGSSAGGTLYDVSSAAAAG